MSMSKDETSQQATRIAWVWIENDEGLYNAVNEQAHAEGQTADACAGTSDRERAAAGGVGMGRPSRSRA